MPKILDRHTGALTLRRLHILQWFKPCEFHAVRGVSSPYAAWRGLSEQERPVRTTDNSIGAKVKRQTSALPTAMVDK